MKCQDSEAQPNPPKWICVLFLLSFTGKRIEHAQTEVYATNGCHHECPAVYLLFGLQQNVSMDERSQTKVYVTNGCHPECSAPN